ncbi:MAG: hypothetical protein ACKPKO_29910, partial [Candidatus Fonsibacter sp.]
MPYKSAYNAQVSQRVRRMSQNHVNREKEINDFATNYEILSQVESSVIRYPEVHGGSGYAAATVVDLGSSRQLAPLPPTLSRQGLNKT